MNALVKLGALGALAGALAAARELGYQQGIHDWKIAQAPAGTGDGGVDTDSPIWQAAQRYAGLFMERVGDGDWEAGLKNYERPPWRTP